MKLKSRNREQWNSISRIFSLPASSLRLEFWRLSSEPSDYGEKKKSSQNMEFQVEMLGERENLDAEIRLGKNKDSPYLRQSLVLW